MNKQTFLKPLILITLLLTSCGESSDEWSPNAVLNRRDNRASGSLVRVNDNYVKDTNYDIDVAIRQAAPYKHVKKNKTTSINYFTYSLDVSGSIFPVGCTMTFYDDGYVEVSSKVRFIYSFDQEKAQSLYEQAFSFVNATNSETSFTE